jgi:hypothetical protein
MGNGNRDQLMQPAVWRKLMGTTDPSLVKALENGNTKKANRLWDNSSCTEANILSCVYIALLQNSAEVRFHG